jgi:hypothetical protein
MSADHDFAECEETLFASVSSTITADRDFSECEETLFTSVSSIITAEAVLL